jgi:hypothetical protein
MQTIVNTRLGRIGLSVFAESIVDLLLVMESLGFYVTQTKQVKV